MKSSDLHRGPVQGSCEHRNEQSGSIKCCELLDEVSNEICSVEEVRFIFINEAIQCLGSVIPKTEGASRSCLNLK
jgi:hypothetical protein